MRCVPSVVVPLAATLFAPTSVAQLGRPNGVRIEVQALASAALAATYDGMVGCARDRDGNYWVTGRRAGTDPNHKLFLFSAAGAFVAAYDQPTETQASAWGLRDLAYDGRDHILYAGCETNVANRLFAFDVANRRFDPSRSVPLPATFTGTARGLAFDARGAGGAGTFLVCDWATPVFEIDRTGTVRDHVAEHEPVQVRVGRVRLLRPGVGAVRRTPRTLPGRQLEHGMQTRGSAGGLRRDRAFVLR